MERLSLETNEKKGGVRGKQSKPRVKKKKKAEEKVWEEKVWQIAGREHKGYNDLECSFVLPWSLSWDLLGFSSIETPVMHL